MADVSGEANKTRDDEVVSLATRYGMLVRTYEDSGQTKERKQARADYLELLNTTRNTPLESRTLNAYWDSYSEVED